MPLAASPPKSALGIEGETSPGGPIVVRADRAVWGKGKWRVTVSISNHLGTGLISPAAALVTLCQVCGGVEKGLGWSIRGGGDRRRCSLHSVVEMLLPLGLSALSGTEGDGGEGTHLEVTSVLWQILSPASLRAAFELSMGQEEARLLW